MPMRSPRESDVSANMSLRVDRILALRTDVGADRTEAGRYIRPARRPTEDAHAA